MQRIFNTRDNTILNIWILQIYVLLITINNSDTKMLEIIQLCKLHVVKFIIFLTSFIQILFYNLLEVSLIIFIATSFVSFFKVKFVITLAFKKKKKHITK